MQEQSCTIKFEIHDDGSHRIYEWITHIWATENETANEIFPIIFETIIF